MAVPRHGRSEWLRFDERATTEYPFLRFASKKAPFRPIRSVIIQVHNGWLQMLGSEKKARDLLLVLLSFQQTKTRLESAFRFLYHFHPKE